MGRASSAKEKIAIFFDNNYTDVCAKAEELRQSYDVSVFKTPKKLGPFLNKLQSGGFIGFAYADGNVRTFEK